MRRPPRFGPALRTAPLPVAGTLVSTIIHAGLAVAVIAGAALWHVNRPKTYVVNLVPAVAAVGLPQGRPAPVLPPRPEEPSPPVAKSAPTDLPPRAPELPSRETRRDPLALPDRALPPRAPALPRADEKERPAMSSTAPPPPRPTTITEAARRDTTPAPPPPLGQVSGSATGAGALTLNVSDFPFAYYLRRVQEKISEKWEGKALQGKQPVVVFEIGRNGQVGGLAVDKTSGNPFYDRVALRAITEASPFPPLPEEFKGSFLRIHLGFAYSAERG